MALYKRDGLVYDQVICEDMALPNATNLTATNTVSLKARESGSLRVRIYAASTTVAIADASTITFTPLFGNTASAGGCLVRALGSFTLTGGDVTLKDPGDVTTTDNPNPLSWTSGTLIHEFSIPADLIGTYKYMKLNIACSGNDSTEKIEAYLFAD